MKKRQLLILALLALGALGFSGASYCQKNTALYPVTDASMAPTYAVDSQVWAWMRAYDSVAPQRGDVALIELPISQLGIWRAKGNATIVRRIIGVPGDRVEFKRGVLTLNGTVQKEPFAKWIFVPSYDLKIVEGKVYTGDVGWWSMGYRILGKGEHRAIFRAATQPIPPNQFLVLGDNRNNSQDSIELGLLPRSVFKGRVLMRGLPKIQLF